MTQRFHLRAPIQGEAPSQDPGQFFSYCSFAESAGFGSIELPADLDFSSALQCAVTAGQHYPRIGFRVSGTLAGMLESLRGREVFEASEALQGRLIVHMCAPDEHDLHSFIFRSAQEFLANLCRESPASGTLRLEIEGDSSMAAYLAIKFADCLWRTPHRPQRVYADALPVLHFGKEVGLCLRVIAEETRQAALDAASMHRDQLEQRDNWLTDTIWLDADPKSPDSALMIGSFQDVAQAILSYQPAGISQIMISGLDGIDALSRLAARVLPLIRTEKPEFQAV